MKIYIQTFGKGILEKDDELFNQKSILEYENLTSQQLYGQQLTMRTYIIKEIKTTKKRIFNPLFLFLITSTL